MEANTIEYDTRFRLAELQPHLSTFIFICLKFSSQHPGALESYSMSGSRLNHLKYSENSICTNLCQSKTRQVNIRHHNLCTVDQQVFGSLPHRKAK